jgi:putative protease
MGYGRLVLERQLSLEQIKAIRSAVGTELEFFVHGALCVCYSGQCYLSEYLAGRSANRGECIQACRSLYDLEDGRGKKLVRNAPLLSLKDLCLEDRLEDLAQAGICSFKIEGRLKSISYVRNVVRKYSLALDELVRKYPDRYCRSAFGTVRCGFLPDLGKAFNRGYTELFLDGTKGGWASGAAATSLGERIGTVRSVSQGRIILQAEGTALHNGDGFCVILPDGRVEGFRADICEGNTIRCTVPEGLKAGMDIYRNYDSAFEKMLEAGSPLREMDVRLSVRSDGRSVRIDTVSEDGREVSAEAEGESAKDPARAVGTLREQLSKRSGIYSFRLESLPEKAPFLPISKINELRRSLAEKLEARPVRMTPLHSGHPDPSIRFPSFLSYKANVANSLDRDFYICHGAETLEDAYELSHRPGAELMRSRYCIRHELGLCPKQSPGTRPEPLFLINNGRRLRLDFDCARCEMSVSEA